MSRPNSLLNASLLLVVVVISAQYLGCGAMYSSQNRVLQSIAVMPASADAQSFSMGQVQFTATGTFSQPPSPATVPFTDPYSGGWTTSNPNIAKINQSGLAQCLSGASGTVTVTATASSNSATGMGQMSTAVLGMARLTCP